MSHQILEVASYDYQLSIMRYTAQPPPTPQTDGGIIGITKTPSALSRWVLYFNMSSCETKSMFGINAEEIWVLMNQTLEESGWTTKKNKNKILCMQH